MKPFKPTLAEDIPDDHPLRPGWVSPKMDGMRLALYDGRVNTRNLLTPANVHVAKLLSAPELQGLDGEVLIKDATDPDVFWETMSAMKRFAGEPDITFNVFDFIDPVLPWELRHAQYRSRVERLQEKFPFLRATPQYHVNGMADLLSFEAEFLAQGYEGIMYRAEGTRYKFGRSTLRDGVLLRRKPFVDIEARITGFYEQKENQNEAFINELGRTQRSSHEANKVGKNTLGGFLMTTIDQHGWPGNKDFRCGNGCDGFLTDAKRLALWNTRDSLVGQIATVSVMKYGSVDGTPRFPKIRAIRPTEDLPRGS